MNDEKEKLEKIAQRVDELLSVLKNISEDVIDLSKSVKLALGTKTILSSPLVSNVKTADKNKSIEQVRMIFPKNLEKLLEFNEKTEYIIIKPKQFLGSDYFAKIASIARELGGEYISAGRDSHFRVPKN